MQLSAGVMRETESTIRAAFRTTGGLVLLVGLLFVGGLSCGADIDGEAHGRTGDRVGSDAGMSTDAAAGTDAGGADDGGTATRFRGVESVDPISVDARDPERVHLTLNLDGGIPAGSTVEVAGEVVPLRYDSTFQPPERPGHPGPVDLTVTIAGTSRIESDGLRYRVDFRGWESAPSKTWDLHGAESVHSAWRVEANADGRSDLVVLESTAEENRTGTDGSWILRMLENRGGSYASADSLRFDSAIALRRSRIAKSLVPGKQTFAVLRERPKGRRDIVSVSSTMTGFAGPTKLLDFSSDTTVHAFSTAGGTAAMTTTVWALVSKPPTAGGTQRRFFLATGRADDDGDSGWRSLDLPKAVRTALHNNHAQLRIVVDESVARREGTARVAWVARVGKKTGSERIYVASALSSGGKNVREISLGGAGSRGKGRAFGVRLFDLDGDGASDLVYARGRAGRARLEYASSADDEKKPYRFESPKTLIANMATGSVLSTFRALDLERDSGPDGLVGSVAFAPSRLERENPVSPCGIRSCRGLIHLRRGDVDFAALPPATPEGTWVDSARIAGASASVDSPGSQMCRRLAAASCGAKRWVLQPARGGIAPAAISEGRLVDVAFGASPLGEDEIRFDGRRILDVDVDDDGKRRVVALSVSGGMKLDEAPRLKPTPPEVYVGSCDAAGSSNDDHRGCANELRRASAWRRLEAPEEHWFEGPLGFDGARGDRLQLYGVLANASGEIDIARAKLTSHAEIGPAAVRTATPLRDLLVDLRIEDDRLFASTAFGKMFTGETEAADLTLQEVGLFDHARRELDKAQLLDAVRLAVPASNVDGEMRCRPAVAATYRGRSGGRHAFVWLDDPVRDGGRTLDVGNFGGTDAPRILGSGDYRVDDSHPCDELLAVTPTEAGHGSPFFVRFRRMTEQKAARYRIEREPVTFLAAVDGSCSKEGGDCLVTGDVTRLATGDFDGDGIDDLYLRVPPAPKRKPKSMLIAGTGGAEFRGLSVGTRPSNVGWQGTAGGNEIHRPIGIFWNRIAFARPN